MILTCLHELHRHIVCHHHCTLCLRLYFSNKWFFIPSRNMFDKPNKDAFYIVTHFLLEKLNPTRFHECITITSGQHKSVWAEFSLVASANAGSKVVASLFLSPGGPKFTSLMLHLTNHVMLQEMKTFTTDDSWIPEDAATPASTLDMAVKRFSLIRTRFLKTAVDQDRFLHEYQRRLDRVLTLYLHYVLKGDADQYILDGMDGVLRIPRCLLERIEKLPHQVTPPIAVASSSRIMPPTTVLQMFRDGLRNVALGFLSPMAPLCFEPAAEASYRSSIFSQYPAKLLGEQHQILIQSTCEVSFGFVKKSSNVHEKVAPVKTKAQIIDLECDNLADQVFSSLFSSVLDVKSSWRKAVEEDNAKKIQQSADFDGSIMRRLSPLPEPCSLLLSPDAASHNVSCSVTPAVMLHGGPHADRQGALLKSSFSWDTFNAEPLDSLSGSSSVQFSLQHETLPEMPSCDSLLSLDDETVAMRSEDEELLIPLLKIESTQSPLTTHKVFSLDLDALETHSPPKKQEYSLPKLITFSPIDDMKC
uniref:HAUS augmin-like complex subunit 6 N-terminal domain-containing protein n=1 Tax=Amphiprion ocellaris TaxID=80972 RepID=A0A3Q1D982_AMPOC